MYTPHTVLLKLDWEIIMTTATKYVISQANEINECIYTFTIKKKSENLPVF